MNTLLQKFFDKHNLSDKDKYEINQIFELLPPDKKQNLLNNFDILVIRLDKIKKDIRMEREILVGEEVKNIRRLIINERKIR